MRFSTVVLHAAAFVALTGCVWSPNERSDAESNSVTLSGYTLSPSDSVTLTAKNLTDGGMGTIGTAVSSATAAFDIDGQEVYPWSATLTTAPDYWAPQSNAAGGLPYSLGRLEVFPTLTSGGESLVSFTAAQQSCMLANMNTVGLAQAASQCGDSDSLVLFDNTGVATPAMTAGFTTLQSGSFPTASPKVNWQVVSYPVGYGTSTLTVYGYVCTPNGAGPYPVQIYNHPSWSGLVGSVPPAGLPLGTDDLSHCIQGAMNGWITGMTAYRGETATFGTTRTYGAGQTGYIETCLGEGTDALRFTNLVLAGSKVNASHVLMWGWSHGGCVTDRAVEQGAPVQAAATFSAMTDLLAMANQICGANNPACNWPFGLPPPNTLPGWGTTPSNDPMAYNWRSPIYFPADLNARTDVKMLAVQGVVPDDGGGWDTVLQPGAACELANLVSPASTNAFLSTTGATMGGAPPDCPSATYPNLTWQSSTGGPAGGGWTWGNRTLLEVDGADHYSVITTGPIWADFMSFVSSLGWGAAPYASSYSW